MATPKPNLDSLFHSALELESPEEREAFLTQVCGDDAVLRSEVERLLESHQKAGIFLEQPAPEYFPSRSDAHKRPDEIADLYVTSHMLPKESGTEETLRSDDPLDGSATRKSSPNFMGELIATSIDWSNGSAKEVWVRCGGRNRANRSIASWPSS